EVNDENRCDEPGEDNDFNFIRCAAQNQIDWKACERGEASHQARQNESTIARNQKGTLLRGDRNQSVDVVSYWRGKTHRPSHVSAADAPLSRADLKTEAIKRRLRAAHGNALSRAPTPP